MLVVITYDVSTEDADGRRRLRKVARVCLDYGQRVQKSVFEAVVSPKEWVELRQRLLGEIDPEHDSLRFYFLNEADRRRIEHYGIGGPLDLEGPLLI